MTYKDDDKMLLIFGFFLMVGAVLAFILISLVGITGRPIAATVTTLTTYACNADETCEVSNVEAEIMTSSKNAYLCLDSQGNFFRSSAPCR